VWLVGSALLAATSALVGCAVTATFTPVVAATHPAYTPGIACDAANCHNQYKHKEPYIGPCENCHNLVNWKRVTYKHVNKEFDQGMHPLIGCPTCHTEGEPLPSPECSACHDAPHKGLQTCSSCHSTLAWHYFKPVPSGHLALDGGHSKLICLDCHTAKATPTPHRTCTSCHGTNHGGLTTCQDCHTPAGMWKPKPGWNHNRFFVLLGHHKTLYAQGKCTACHVDNRFAGTPKVCVGCHGRQHGGLSDCASCHTTTAFEPPLFRHSSVFALTGAHAKLKCTTCHPNKVFTSAHAFGRTITRTHPACGDCHTPHHGGLTQCAECHTTSSFANTTFKHSTVFPLVGAHAALAAAGKCSACHPGGRFASVLGRNCVDCHGGDSPHGSSVGACSQCHSPSAANGFNSPSAFPDHPVALNAHHANPQACRDCHQTLVFSSTRRPCESCHAGAGSAATKIPHVGPTDCYSCHRPTVWSDTSKFTHPAIPIVPPHTAPPHTSLSFGGYPLGCEGCHPGPDFTSHTCTACHD
jgi:hypothetical protein